MLDFDPGIVTVQCCQFLPTFPTTAILQAAFYRDMEIPILAHLDLEHLDILDVQGD
jgi:hypothetical protein